MYKLYHTNVKKTAQTSKKTRLTYLGTSDEPSSEPVIMYDADSRLVTIEGDIALAIQQAKYSHSTILVTHGDVDAIG